MIHIREGAKVSYIGYGETGLEVGDRGKVIAHSGSASHVRWITGTATGQVTLTSNNDLVEPTVIPEDDIDLSSDPIATVAVRAVYDYSGEVGLVNAMSDAGLLASFSDIAEDALGWVHSRVANDPNVREAMSHLDAAEQAEVLNLMASALLKDAFTEGEES